eukprot:Hpha_TRINITY_DN12556_c0_g2::TRINITY_DN12556_c0_g2_i1::g.50888::m.50888/K00012/UGDH, ugd; UDPglucose 6-dehydrogenase
MALAEDVIRAKKLTLVGIGRLGLCSALVYEKAGWDVVGVDVVPDYIEAINNRTLRSPEPQVTEMLQASRNLRATLSLPEGVAHSDLIMILVPTPTGPKEDVYDCTTLSKVLDKLNTVGVSNKHVVIVSTVLPGYISKVARHLLRDSAGVTVSYSPEFIAQGDVIRGLLTPDFQLIGEGSKDAGDILVALYNDASQKREVPMCRMSPESAEINKIANNCFVTTKIAFSNMIGDICDRTPGADKEAVMQCVGLDARIGSKCIMPGYGVGGPCLPRDNRALGVYARIVGIDPKISVATDEYHHYHADNTAQTLLDRGLDHYVFTDVAYKRCCPVAIIEESQPLQVAAAIVHAGRKVTVRDRAEIIHEVRLRYGSTFEYEVVDDPRLHSTEHGQVTNKAGENLSFRASCCS